MDNPSADRDYKAELDKLATGTKTPPKNEKNEDTSIANKVSQYVPAVGKLLGGSQMDEPESKESPSTFKPPGPPHRTQNDPQIEDFIRDQHRSEKMVAANEVTDT
ncbi:hypothetical protein VTJ49DRAFT_1996 [Mycothermus thermophilus]|uniref:Uncharacterized protein n=1 Tax=Humicola insolens TaxID=85995 RepID=A0ABR3VB06_HUMIN